MSIYFTSDLHFGHEREFLYKPRGFDNVWDMNDTIIENWNKTISMDDDVYVLGDLMLGNTDASIKLLKSLKGNIHIILGNHDSDARIKLYNECHNVVEIVYATVLKYRKYTFYLSHYPTLTANLEGFNSLHQCVINLYGHTHQKTNFFNDIPYMYHVGMDSHNCTPILLDDIIEEMKAKVEECKAMLQNEVES